MALSELAALDAAYQVLRPLNAAARRRALQWLSDALATESVLPSSVEPPSVSPSSSSSGASSSGASSSGAATPRRPRRRATTSSAAGASATGAGAGAGVPRKRAKRADATARRGSRPYRRMPPVEEVMAAYRQAGSVSAMAEHFGVPGHTVQGWARQLRRNGYAIGQSR